MTSSEFACITIRDWLRLQLSYGTAQPEIIVYADGVEIPRQAIVIQATGNDDAAGTVAMEVSLVLDQADFTESAHRDAAEALRYRLIPAAPQYQPGVTIVSCHPDFAAWTAATPGSRVFDLVGANETHTADGGRLVYLLSFSAVVMMQ